MKLFKYVLQYHHQQQSVLFNTLTRNITLVNKNTLNSILSSKTHKNKKQAELLRKNNFLVPKGFNDLNYAKFWFNKYKYNSSTIDITLLTTYRCQFACSYCSQDDIKMESDLSGKNAQLIAQKVLEITRAVCPEELRIGFFGGEPLLNVPAIEKFIKTIRTHSDMNNVNCHYDIVTNGFLLNKNNLELLVKLGIESIQITVDGTPKTHNARRRLKNGDCTFQRIYNNIRYASKKIPVIIQINIDRDNVSNIYSLIDKLDKDNIKKNIVLSLGKIINYHTCASPEEKNITSEIMKNIFDLQIYALLKGFRCYDFLKVGICPGHHAYSFIIDPGGDMYRCITGVGHKEFRVANILKHDFNQISFYDSKFLGTGLWENDTTCKECVYLPMCWGGCRYQALMNFKNVTKKVCNKNIFDDICGALIEYELIKYALEQKGGANGKEKETGKKNTT